MGRPRGSKNKAKDEQMSNGQAGEPVSANAGALAEKAADTLRGDIRDEILREMKAMSRPWHAMNEQEQERLIWRARDIADQVVRQAVDIVASRGLPALPIQVGKFTVDGSAVKGNYECYADDENLLRIRHIAGARAMFVLASPDAYRGEQKTAEPEVVGDLAMPKERADEALLEQVGRGNGLVPEPPVSTASPPFHLPADA